MNTAARMESHGELSGIQISVETCTVLGDAYAYQPRGVSIIKDKVSRIPGG